MFLTKIGIQHFRNYTQVALHSLSRYNVITGNNAQGKSNFLESVYYLCASKSYRRSPDEHLVQFDESFFEINADFLLDSGTVKKVRILFTPTEGKRITINREPIIRRSDLIGMFPVVFMSSEDSKVTSGPQAERRRFIDMLLCQTSPKYLNDLRQYMTIIKQRNALLRSGGAKKISGQLDAWNESMVRYGCQLIMARRCLVEEIRSTLEQNYRTLTNQCDRFSIAYAPQVKGDDVESVRQEYHRQLKSSRQKEVAAGMSIIGPHRDRFILDINGKEARFYGSQGEHKSIILALRLSEYEIIRKKREEVPLLLLDDLPVDLDSLRVKKIYQLLPESAQIFITATSREAMRRLFSSDEEVRYYRVAQGNIAEDK